MVFSSLTFLFFFLPVFFLMYWLLPARWKNAFLFAGSLIFYGWLQPVFVLLLLAEITIGYLGGRGIDGFLNRNQKPQAKAVLILSIAVFTGLLGWFKYADFFIETIREITGWNLTLLKIVLPLGISFYTFQLISYVADIYLRKAPALTSWIDFGCYISMFCQLVAGPIVRYTQIREQLEHRSCSWQSAAAGWSRFLCGLAKKVILADSLYSCLQVYQSAGSVDVLYTWFYAIACMLYVYYDFSGYSDMAIGLGQMMGFTLPENFDYPYTAGTITGFWRRWHLSLTAWFRDYVYIPMGGNRVSSGRWLFNMLVVWLLTGFWHGASWNYILWGLYFFVLLVMEKVLHPEKKIPAFLYRVLVLVLLAVSFQLFWQEDLSVFRLVIRRLSGLESLPLTGAYGLYQIRSNLILLIIAIAGSGPWLRSLWKKMGTGVIGQAGQALAEAGILLACIAILASGSFSPFLYFRF